ncbi:MAG: hypothetical protein L0H23_01795 [Luteimonas sp.]|nr:hypothetical protein [Luteimonas sp.]
MTMRLWCLGACIFLAACAVSTHAMSRVWDAEVRQVANSPCFAIGDAPDVRGHAAEIGVLSVFEVQADGREVWAVGSKAKEALILRTGECLEYGDDISGANTMVQPQPLSAGKAYGISFNAKVGSVGPSRRYRAYFCLVRTNDEDVVVQQVKWDRDEGAWRWDVCGLAAGG